MSPRAGPPDGGAEASGAAPGRPIGAWLFAGGCVALAALAALLDACLWGRPYPSLTTSEIDVGYAALATFAALFAVLATWIAVTDLRQFEIPDEANVALFLTGLAWSAIGPPTIPVLIAFGVLGDSDAPSWLVHAAPLVDGLARSVVATGSLLAVRALYRSLRGIDGLGLGDVKLAGAAAPWLVWSDLPMALLLAVGAALVATVAAALAGRKELDRAAWIPLGAFLAPAAFVVWLLRLAGLPLGLAG